MASPPTRNGTRKLSEIARKVVSPSDLTSTAWPGVRDACRRQLGITFDDWQDGAGRLILAKRADGKLAATIGGVGMSVPRQVGKTYLIGGMAFGLAVTRPKMLMIWSAHHARTHGETFLAMQEFAKRSKVRAHIDRVYMGSGDEEIRFKNGSRILFGARERGFGRGIPGVDMIVSDEAQIMSEKALDAQLATMNTSQFGLAIYIGTPPRPEDPSEAFTRMRTEAWAGELRDAVWIEVGADRDASPADRKQWAKANPSFPHRTPVESIQRLQRKLSAESFLREGLGIWDDDTQVGPLPGWGSCEDSRTDSDGLAVSKIVGKVTVALDVAWDRQGCGLAVAGMNADDRLQVELVEDDTPIHLGNLVRRAAEVVKAHGARGVHLEKASAAGSLIPALKAAGVKVFEIRVSEVNQACGFVHDAVKNREIVHLGQKALDLAVEGTQKRASGDSWRWDRRQGADISPFMAATLAVWGAADRKPAGNGRVVVLG
jgi:hypothetical protein